MNIKVNKFVFDDGSEIVFSDFSNPRGLRDSNKERPSALYVDTGRLFRDERYRKWVSRFLIPRLKPVISYE